MDKKEFKFTKENTLKFLAVQRAEPFKGLGCLVMVFEDHTGASHFALVGCKSNHQDGIEKAFSRLSSFEIPGECFEAKENSVAEPPYSVSPERG